MSHKTTPPTGFRENPETGELACPHRDVSCCPTCAAAHGEIVEVYSQHFWTHSAKEKAELVALTAKARTEPRAEETRPCVSCGAEVPEQQKPPFPGHRHDCKLVASWAKPRKAKR